MAAITSHFNPDGSAPDEILTFYNDQDAQLGFELVAAGSTDVVTYSSAKDSTKGFIRNPSQLAVVHYNRLTRVYAVTADTTENPIVLISPGFKDMQLHTESKYGSLAACGDDASQAWLYFLQGNPMTIIEYDLRNQVSNTLNIPNVLDGTALAACYDKQGGNRYLICQSHSASPNLLRVQGGGADPVENSDIAAPNTPIAVCANPTRSQIQIYFKNNADNHVHRISWAPSGGYSDSKKIGEAEMDPFTTISATASPDGSKVHVFYVYQENDQTRALAHVTDSWYDISEKVVSEEDGKTC
ncbi:hypothetical protein V8F20_012447 [Naviculisporaceae sp. PSN 640]